GEARHCTNSGAARPSILLLPGNRPALHHKGRHGAASASRRLIRWRIPMRRIPRLTIPLAFVLATCLAGANQEKQPTRPSHVTVMTLDGQKQVIYSAPRRFEAPNWSPDGKYLLLNSEGKLWRLSLAGGEPERVPTGSVTGINNDHGIAPDGKLLAISAGHI